jgi:hypothetical protein
VRICTGTATCTGSSVTGDVVQVLEATNAAITISSAQVTINFASDLSGNTTYYVSIDSGAFRDAASNTYTGLTAGTSWNFTTVALTCAQGGVCAVGDTGPGGGIVFYVAGSNFTSTGSDCDNACRYLEAATSDQSASIVWATSAAFCYNSGSSSSTNNCQANSIYSGDAAAQSTSRTAATGIGQGMANTNQIYARLTTAGSVATANYAAGVAWAYTNNGKTDWHLPSKDELNQLYLQQAIVGSFSADYYWSSSEYSATLAWRQYFLNGLQNPNLKTLTLRVRPVRAF